MLFLYYLQRNKLCYRKGKTLFFLFFSIERVSLDCWTYSKAMDFLKQSSKQLFWIQSELWLNHSALFYSSQVLLCTLCRWKMNLQPKQVSGWLKQVLLDLSTFSWCRKLSCCSWWIPKQDASSTISDAGKNGCYQGARLYLVCTLMSGFSFFFYKMFQVLLHAFNTLFYQK